MADVQMWVIEAVTSRASLNNEKASEYAKARIDAFADRLTAPKEQRAKLICNEIARLKSEFDAVYIRSAL